MSLDDLNSRTVSRKHLLGIEGFGKQDITTLLDVADTYAASNEQLRKSTDLLKGMTQVNLFFENSTRTLISFELAGKRHGMDVVNFNATSSSLAKGETLSDTLETVDAMQPDVLVVRHGKSGITTALADHVNCILVNAGDGTNEHPTQALLDALTIRRHLGGFEGKTIAICGDILHSRVAGSNIRLLSRMGANVRLVGPKDFLPTDGQFDAALFDSMDEGIKDADAVMMLRIQKERMDTTTAPSEDDYHTHYGLTKERLKLANDHAIVMHPGPMNRGVEIASDVADDKNRSVILEQVAMGVAVRMAVLDVFTRPLRNT
ncbi:MAG: aspartate carbamoyltransferase catalytic subunit [Sphingomonadales bacterium]|nr:aspartate carbamoyltransferase catalytic subunit [Sphingomonadales bacterium]